ncbi:hypothetical protein CsSME_00010958 [Camellia sinensis var. sinensis]
MNSVRKLKMDLKKIKASQKSLVRLRRMTACYQTKMRNYWRREQNLNKMKSMRYLQEMRTAPEE